MTDESGKALAESAIEIVDKVNNVAGEVLGARSDEQFRIYIQTKPGVERVLA